MRISAVILIAMLGLGLSGCRTANPDVPRGFVSVKSAGDVLLHAVAPTGNRLRARRHENPPEGTLEFWREAVERELTAGRGYEVVESRAVTGRDGRSGFEMLFRVTRPEAAYLYLVVIRVAGRDVIVAEAGGEEESLGPDLEELRAVMR